MLVIVAIVFGFLYFRESTSAPVVDTGGTNFFSDFNPFGTSKTVPPKVTTPTIIPIEPEPTIEIIRKLNKVSSMPVAGFGIFRKEKFKKEFASALRYVDKATGNIYQTFADEIDERQFSATIIPKIYEAYFGNNAESVVMRYLKTDDRTIETFIGSVPKELLGGDTTEKNEIKGYFLPENITDVSISPDGSKILYFLNVGDGIIGSTSSLASSSLTQAPKKTQIFDSAFTEWLPFWPNTKMITISTKPAANVPGHMYSFDPNKKVEGGLNKILGDINGLTALTSPSGKLILYGNDNLNLNIFHVDTKASDLLGVRTLPEKCTWNNKGNKTSTFIYCAVPKLVNVAIYPDAWYQGEISFSDEIWKINVENGNAIKILDPMAERGEEIDGIKLALDESENYLFFVNKKDSYLWELNLR